MTYLILIVALTLLLSASTPADAQAILQHSTPVLKDKVEVSQLCYASGSLKVKSQLYLPHKRQTPLPTVIFCHDGCNGISNSHHKSCLRLARMGYAVLSPTYRGEDGSQGQIEIAKGEVDDVLHLWPVIRELPQLDSNRVFLMGASHGALISLLAASHHPELKGLIFAYGVSDIYNWWNYLKANNKIGNDAITRATYGNGPQSRPQSFAIRHGLTAVPKLQAPVLILQGELDDIVPAEQAITLHQECQKHNIASELCLYPHALHGFLVYAPYLKDATANEKEEAEQAWHKIEDFLGSKAR